MDHMGIEPLLSYVFNHSGKIPSCHMLLHISLVLSDDSETIKSYVKSKSLLLSVATKRLE